MFASNVKEINLDPEELWSGLLCLLRADEAAPYSIVEQAWVYERTQDWR
jgi:hypothetical protein